VPLAPCLTLAMFSVNRWCGCHLQVKTPPTESTRE
jgi:hypothetical protein